MSIELKEVRKERLAKTVLDIDLQGYIAEEGDRDSLAG